ncbi:hypothetical protein [Nonomuraea aridisoli]|jgi:hypothetical protein|uniref:Uncharacterized protein n=1 Tax=Nonomuraea aridisoli TaxID=2070368 RepID=A0A2W2EX59_9ACTN|nr:hypothetical protein [Nonomuraea aridisoli]PZG17068.1 hypothetical protein C1J01_19085 [Nonomuraea aridisoli]
MTGTRTPFAPETAPCGRKVGGERFMEDDGYGLLIRDWFYTCGCRRIRHEYHDGSIHMSAVRHDGKRIKDQAEPDRGK